MRLIKDLGKNEKIALIAAISSGEVDRKNLLDNTFVCSKKDDTLLGLMHESGGCKVVYISEAKQTLDKALKRRDL